MIYLHIMKVHLIKTPEYDSEKFRSVYELLSSFDGPMTFSASQFEFSASDFKFLENSYPYFKSAGSVKKLLYDIQLQNELSWEQLFSLCNFYRQKFRVEDLDFVVLLTERKNYMNWFSVFDTHNNAFVQTSDWDLYTDCNSKYPIAYEIVANVLHTLMKIPLELLNPFVHETPKGCVNDLCQDKRQIILKLQTANICRDCIEKMRAENVGSEMLNQVRAIFNGIRNEFVFQTEEHPLEPLPLVVDNGGKILLPSQNLEIRLTPLFKTLYLFFLSKPDGITLNQLSDYKEELLSIYRRLRPSAAKEDAEIRIDNLSHPFGEGFNPTKTHINRIITELLKEPLADFYRISGERGEPYKIKVPRTLVDIRY